MSPTWVTATMTMFAAAGARRPGESVPPPPTARRASRSVVKERQGTLADLPWTARVERS